MLLKDFTVYLLTLDVLFILVILFIWFMFRTLDFLLVLLIKKVFKKYIHILISQDFY